MLWMKTFSTIMQHTNDVLFASQIYTHTHTDGYTQMDTLRAHVSYSDNTQTSHDVISCLTLAVREMYVGKCRSRPRM